MSFWALALHKRGNSKNDGAAKGRPKGGNERERARGVLVLRLARRYRRFPRAARADLTMRALSLSSSVPLAFRLPVPFSSLRPFASGLP